VSIRPASQGAQRQSRHCLSSGCVVRALLQPYDDSPGVLWLPVRFSTGTRRAFEHAAPAYPRPPFDGLVTTARWSALRLQTPAPPRSCPSATRVLSRRPPRTRQRLAMHATTQPYRAEAGAVAKGRDSVADRRLGLGTGRHRELPHRQAKDRRAGLGHRPSLHREGGPELGLRKAIAGTASFPMKQNDEP
jgi:hypothetical protein